MAAKRQKPLELNAHRQAKVATREQARLAQNEESRQWQAALRGQHRQQAPVSSAAILHCQMCEARAKRWARLQVAKEKNGNEASPSRAPTNCK
jgi:hypothetical protein